MNKNTFDDDHKERLREEELDHQNEYVENYMTVEIVAIPPDFDIMNYLSLREQAGIFKNRRVNKKHLAIIAEGVKASPVFSMLNNIRIDTSTCLYFLKVIHELGLVLKTLYNPMREQIDNYLERMDTNEMVYIRGQRTNSVNFTIINIFPMMNEDVINEAMTIAQKLQEYQEEVEDKLGTIDNI